MQDVLPPEPQSGFRPSSRHALVDVARPALLQYHLCLLLVASASFALYWYSAHLLQTRQAPQFFGADNWWYAKLAHGEVIDRMARFHPITIGIALSWMKLFGPLEGWISSQHVLSALFAAIGAAGAWAATWAFSAVLPLRQAVCWGLIYATSFGVWFFSSIEESKILTATFAAFYIGAYLHLRPQWTRRRAVALTAVLFLACLNEIVSVFLVAIPLLDTFQRHKQNWHRYRWIVVHAMAGPVALVILEFAINGWLVARDTDPEGASHVAMFFHYVAKADHSLSSLHAFLLNWVLFNLAAPTADAPFTLGRDAYFVPFFGSYFLSPIPAVSVLSLTMVGLVAWLYRYRWREQELAGLALALSAYTILRGAFFFLFNPSEPLLFSPGVTLAHLLIVAVPLSRNMLPGGRLLIAGTLVVLFAGNVRFFIGTA